MSGKLKDYKVLDILCGGTFYKVRHKVTNNIFAWKAYDCSAYSDERIQNIARDVTAVSRVRAASLLRHHDTVLHAPSGTLYLVLEHNCWPSLEALLARAADNELVAEGFVWYLLLELARICKAVAALRTLELRKCITPATIFIGESCQLRVNCFELAAAPIVGAMRQVGAVTRRLCDTRAALQGHYSEDLRGVVSLLTDERNDELRPDVILHHPTVLANTETRAAPTRLSDIFVTVKKSHATTEVNKCDSDKAVELCRAVEPAPRTRLNIADSPIYCNITPKPRTKKEIGEFDSNSGSLSPTLAALALELPGFVPRSRKPLSQALQAYKPQQVSEDTLSQQWMSRLIALRQREESLNKRERDLIAKEIVNSPAIKIIPLHSPVVECASGSNGITLPPVTRGVEADQWVSRRRHRRASSVRTRSRRKTFGYEDLDSSLSADPGDTSVILTATKFTKENIPRRNIFPDIATKKVHFTSANPFVESDESVTLTFYELENVDGDGYQVPRHEEKVLSDITKFKYLDLEKLTSEKRSAMQQLSQSSPSKQPKMTKVFSDITNTNGIKKTPSKCSLMSKDTTSNSSRYSTASCMSQWSMESATSKMSEGSVSERTRSGARLPQAHTPAPPEVKKSKRKSLLPFKTPFKFMTSTKI